MVRSLSLAAALTLSVLLPLRSGLVVPDERNSESFRSVEQNRNSNLALHGGAEVVHGDAEHGLRLPVDSYAEWSLSNGPTTSAGTLTMWVKPLWGMEDHSSHTFATFKWSGSDHSYFALSQGWWEPQGAGKLYVVLSNQQFVFCLMPWEFNYTLFLPHMWTMLGVTWRSGNPGFVRLFVDGKKVCERKLDYASGRHLLGPVYLGSDRGAPVENRSRSSDMVVDDIVFSQEVADDEAIHREYVRSGGTDRAKWMLAMISSDIGPSPAHERRLMLDEDTQWASSKLEVARRVNRIKSAGFNIYAPCVWDGAHAYFVASKAPIAPRIQDAADNRYDPLGYLIALAHDAGIEVHPWVVIARRAGEDFPKSYTDGAPQGAFNVQSREFRDFIVGLTLDLVARYQVDGINLDYVRAIGPCSSNECIEAYRRSYGRSLLEDWSLQEQGQTVPSMIEWNRKAIGDIVGRISSGIRQLKRRAVLTIDTVPFDQGRQHQGMNEDAWLRSGIVDALVDMAYDDPLDMDNLDAAVRSWSAARQIIAVRNYDIFGDAIVDRSGIVMADYIRLIRARWPGAGVAFYHYPHLDSAQRLELRRHVFSQFFPARWTR